MEKSRKAYDVLSRELVPSELCRLCSRLVPKQLWGKNGELCFQCACDVDMEEARALHRAADLVDHRRRPV